LFVKPGLSYLVNFAFFAPHRILRILDYRRKKMQTSLKSERRFDVASLPAVLGAGQLNGDGMTTATATSTA